MELKILIVDDQPATALFLKSIIEEVPEVTVVSMAASGGLALIQAQTYQPQVVFMYIDMPDMNGLEVARTLVAKKADIDIVFATAHPEYALQAFEIYSFDYILKPFNAERVKKTVRRLKDKISRQLSPVLTANTMLSLEFEGRRVFLRPSEIIYIESRKPKRVLIKTIKNDYLIKGDLNSLEQKLQPQGFFRSHRGYLVNLQQIKEIIPSGHTFQIVLQSGDKILLSRQHEKTLNIDSRFASANLLIR